MEKDPINERQSEGYDTIITKQPLVDETKNYPDNDRKLPVGLIQLSKARAVTVSQLIDPVEVLCCCFARPCRYSVYVDQDTELSFYTQEVSDCYARQIMGAARNFGLKFTDTDNIDVIRVVRPQTCSRGCCGICCVLPSLEVQSPPGTTVAVIKERRTCCCPVYDILDMNEEVIFTLNPACAYFSLVNLCCFDIEINIVPILDRDDPCDQTNILTKFHEEQSTKFTLSLCAQITDKNGELAAKLCKQTRGRCAECSGAANDFSITYVQELPVMQKASILASVFLIDFHYFERQNRCCC